MSQETAIAQCLSAIEEKLGWGERDRWTNYDFEQLSDRIHEATGTQLSITTLKRLWGRVNYQSNPSTATLNALAQFLQFDDWRAFCGQLEQEQPAPPKREETATPATTTAAAKVFMWIVGVGTVVLMLTTIMGNRKRAPQTSIIRPDDYRFSSEKVLSSGVPNSVVFRYSAPQRPEGNLFISQNWDVRRKVKVSAQDSLHSSMYYYPGFFRAKLIQEETIVAEHDLRINSEGWVAAIHQPSPIYFDPTDFQQEDTLQVTQKMLAANGYPLEPKLPEVRYYNVPAAEGLTTDNFTFNANLRSDYDRGSGSCQHMEVLLLCKNSALVVPLSAPGCVGDLSLFALGQNIDSNRADLSGFGVDLSEWTNLRIEGRDRNLRFWVNEQLAYETSAPEHVFEIVGVNFRMQGPGAVYGTWLTSHGQTVRF
ncbi:hypothetical protein [Lewinella sp. W8]|uniref:hypothetical protein n=1 Tax=Lewinella sp. W8 TaxID=2528208 RepID=UPI001068300F|nr:hypothetical protein [Lewinella sp. W8]MTB53760.1 hypothetical protein [Lewinella sp. W8]